MLIASKVSRTGALANHSGLRRFMALQRAHKIKLRRLNSCDQPATFGIAREHSVRVKPEEAA